MKRAHVIMTHAGPGRLEPIRKGSPISLSLPFAYITVKTAKGGVPLEQLMLPNCRSCPFRQTHYDLAQRGYYAECVMDVADPLTLTPAMDLQDIPAALDEVECRRDQNQVIKESERRIAVFAYTIVKAENRKKRLSLVDPAIEVPAVAAR